MTKRACSGALVASLLCIGPSLSGQVQKEADLTKVYGSRWIPLPMPDSRIGPGAIVTIKKGQVAWESSLDKCGAPADVMKPTSSNDTAITTKLQGEYGADAALKIAGISIGPDFKKAKKSSLQLDDHHAEGLDRITLGEWLNKPGTVLSAVCQRFLTQKDVFIVQEAYKVGRGKLTLYDSKNTKLALSGISVSIIKLAANATATSLTDNTIEFSTPMFTAIRRLQYMKDNSLKTLGSSRPEATADAAARALLNPKRTEVR